ncbi:Beauvericin cluster-specific repressor BEA4 [Pseudocercospora fuligena]|uniref:Beauvericin cluster-specific repressor BEA4 n=1 Tax=Pseudocercospora fuligena TaxID=685502 RepID=A0A8H6VQZ9_9PEZI|nr:Beauvericin cluster-specific repressor BEA4 [Pseudocercospora fuligena]
MADTPIKRRRGNAKSRGGCSRCKSQHLKCDEQKPSCGRCTRLGVQCPGYVQQLKWLTKHEHNEGSLKSTAEPTASTLPSEAVLSPLPTLDSLDWMSLTPPLAPLDDPQPNDPLLDVSGPSNWSATTQPAPIEMNWDHNMSFANLEQITEAHEPKERQIARPRKRSLLQALQGNSGDLVPRPQRSLTHESTELMSYYFKEVTRMYAMYDDHRNPFRSVVSSVYSHSLVINLAAQSMAAACLAEVHPRFSAIGRRLRNQAMEIVSSEAVLDHRALLALMMFGPTGNWHDTTDLGLGFYNLMRDRIDSMALSGELALHEKSINSFNFFREAMIHWEMLLVFAVDSDSMRPCKSPIGPVIELSPNKRIAHPWTGVGRDIIQVCADIGRLVRSHRVRHQTQQFVTQAYIANMRDDLESARTLESRLLACKTPDASTILEPDDPGTPVWHLTTLAEVYRYAGLSQLYRVFPDVLLERLRGETPDSLTISSDEHRETDRERCNRWLTAFSLEALRLLQTVPLESGTRDFQPFLLVALSSELVCDRSQSPHAPGFDDMGGESIDTEFVEVSMIRKFVLDRLAHCLRLLPPKPIRVAMDIVKETWRRIDSGLQDVYWLDVMMQNCWETILA